MKKVRKGFTLVEMIVVLAIFSIIMFSIVQLLPPVSKFFVRSTNFENTTACVDNMKRCIEGNLKYANRVRAYDGYVPYTRTWDASAGKYDYIPTTGTDGLAENLERFYDEFFKDRKFIDSSGVIYVLCFDNTELASDTELANDFERLADFSEGKSPEFEPFNSGKILQYQFKFDNYDTSLDEFSEVFASRETNAWAVNQKLYGNFEYKFILGGTDATVSGVSVAASTDTSGNEITPAYSFNPQDFSISINMCEILRQSGGGLYRGESTRSNVASFSMKNVLDSTVKYAKPSYDHVTKCVDETAIDHEYSVASGDTGNPPRYKTISTNPVSPKPFDGFYFIYTLPETTYSNSANYATQKPLT